MLPAGRGEQGWGGGVEAATGACRLSPLLKTAPTCLLRQGLSPCCGETGEQPQDPSGWAPGPHRALSAITSLGHRACLERATQGP